MAVDQEQGLFLAVNIIAGVGREPGGIAARVDGHDDAAERAEEPSRAPANELFVVDHQHPTLGERCAWSAR